MSTDQDIYFMRMALEEAESAYRNDEVPIGAIAVNQHGAIAGRGFNSPISHNDPSAHAEIIALREAASYMKNYRLNGITLYVTLEPCLMCFGAMIQARVGRLVFGAYDTRSGITNNIQFIGKMNLNHKIKIEGGVLQESCSELLRKFFLERR